MSSTDDFGWYEPPPPAQRDRNSTRAELLPTVLAILWSITVLVVMLLSVFGTISGASTFRLALVLLAVFAAGFALKSVRDEHRSRATSSRTHSRSR